ncbi:hypothetical protein [Streptomyces sp. NPDC001297]|uniref:hypothetical protein n=1 Tax=Streptomyces sp. NPDC001297 TaxID=3364559 RepID=UPI0036802F68
MAMLMTTITGTTTTWVAIYGWGPETDAPAVVVYSTATREETARELADQAAEEFGREQVNEGSDQEPQLWTVLRVPAGHLPPEPDEHAAALYVSERD